MYVISLVKIRKNFWLFLRILAMLIVIGLVLPRFISAVGKWMSPGVGWINSRAQSIVAWFGDALAVVSERLSPFVETLKQYYQGK